MRREDCRRGMKVCFGRLGGERTMGEVVKLNDKKAKVKTLEQRGNGRGSTPGTLWNVPYSLLTPVGVGVESMVVTEVLPLPLTYSPVARIENLVLEAILACYHDLSPEYLTGDGEASRSYIRTTRSRLERQLRGLQAVYGRQVTEEEIFEWWKLKNAFHASFKKPAKA